MGLDSAEWQGEGEDLAATSIFLARALWGDGVSNIISGNFEAEKMAKAMSNLAAHRARMEREGFVRVEVKVRKEDANLLRQVASALADPVRQVEARRLLQAGLAAPTPTSLKALLASAPLKGIDLERSPEAARAVEL